MRLIQFVGMKIPHYYRYIVQMYEQNIRFELFFRCLTVATVSLYFFYFTTPSSWCCPENKQRGISYHVCIVSPTGTILICFVLDCVYGIPQERTIWAITTVAASIPHIHSPTFNSISLQKCERLLLFHLPAFYQPPIHLPTCAHINHTVDLLPIVQRLTLNTFNETHKQNGFLNIFRCDIWHLCQFYELIDFTLTSKRIINAPSFDLDARLMLINQWCGRICVDSDVFDTPEVEDDCGDKRVMYFFRSLFFFYGSQSQNDHKIGYIKKTTHKW